MDIVKNSAKYIWVSAVMILLSLAILLFGKLNLWIDMTWGIQMDYDYEQWVNIQEINEEISLAAKNISYKRYFGL